MDNQISLNGFHPVNIHLEILLKNHEIINGKKIQYHDVKVDIFTTMPKAFFFTKNISYHSEGKRHVVVFVQLLLFILII